jgi:hypothetical protein
MMSNSESSTAGAAEAVVAAFHAGLARNDPDRVRSLLGETFFMADERTDDRTNAVRAHMYLDGDKLNEWPANFLAEAGPYENSGETVAVSVRQGSAIVRTRDTGSNRFRQWRREENVWVLGGDGETWRIIGWIVRDIQLPESAD